MAASVSLDDIVSHWSTLIESLQTSPLEFYRSVEGALDRREVPETKRSRVDYRETGVASAKREYLHVERDRLVLDICAAPFGTGFFVSWWLSDMRPKLHPALKIAALIGQLIFASVLLNIFGFIMGLLVICIGSGILLWGIHTMAMDGETSDDYFRELPILGNIYNWLFKGATLYRLDTAMMFQKAVHNAVLEVIDEITTAKGLRALGAGDRTPVMREFYQRKAA